MDERILDTTSPLVFVPVRHHSPACARAVREIARALRPAAILIEGPSDFNDRIEELHRPHTLPIAIYSYVRDAAGSHRGAFYPFCAHSPEWQALEVARELGVAARFIDLPWAAIAAPDVPAHRYADAELRESPYVPTLCQRLGVEDFDSLWDTLAEIDETLSPAELLARVHALCYAIRATSPRVDDEDVRRESFMAAQIEAAQQTFGGPLLVVTGGFHSYALFERLNAEGVTAPSPSLSRPLTGERSELHPLTPSLASAASLTPSPEVGIALTPYAEARLDGLAGYDAGMPSPGFYRHVWEDRAAGRADTYRGLLARAVTELRGHGQVASTADLIAVETSARALAALRGHAAVWRIDLLDAITGALIKEAVEPDTRHPFLDALLQVFRGDRRGALAEGTALPPLVHDIRQQLDEHDLEPTTKPCSVRLDLALPRDLARSRVLHRLRVLGVPGFTQVGGTDLRGRSDLQTIWEGWGLAWSPELDAACIEAAVYGVTLHAAAAARLEEQAAGTARSAERAALLLLDACLLGLGDALMPLFEQLVALVRHDSDFFSVAAALGHLLFLFRYDDVLGALGNASIGALLRESFGRAIWLLEMLGQPAVPDPVLLNAFRSLLHAFEACEAPLALDRTLLADALARTGSNAAQRPLVRGAATGALWSLRAASLDYVSAGLQSCAAPDRIGDFLTGLFALARESAQRHPELVRSIDALLMAFDDDAYLHALPALRLAFSFFTPREKHYLARTLLAAHGQPTSALPPLEVDVAVAARALAVEGALLAALERYGIRGGTA